MDEERLARLSGSKDADQDNGLRDVAAPVLTPDQSTGYPDSHLLSSTFSHVSSLQR